MGGWEDIFDNINNNDEDDYVWNDNKKDDDIGDIDRF
jgi:hypothetical protein